MERSNMVTRLEGLSKDNKVLLMTGELLPEEWQLGDTFSGYSFAYDSTGQYSYFKIDVDDYEYIIHTT